MLIVAFSLWVLGGALDDAGVAAGQAVLGLALISSVLLVVFFVYLAIRSVYRFVKRVGSRSSRARVDQQIASLAADHETELKATCQRNHEDCLGF